MTARITGVGTALPGSRAQAELWEEHFRERYGDSRLAKAVFANSGVERRHGVIDPLTEDISGLGTAARMQRYTTEALPLGKDAVAGALNAASLDPADVGLFAVVSCTGYATPGLDIVLARDLGMTDEVRRLVVGHMGCYAALPGLGAVADFVAARARPAVMLCVELTSLHAQPPTESARSRRPTADDTQQMVAHALFADGAAAVVVQPGRPGPGVGGLEVVDVAAQTDVSTSDHMTWDVTDLGFKMGLSPRVPDVLARHVRGVVDRLLARHGLGIPDVAGWAVHPGGPRILEVVAQRLELPDGALRASYEVLREVGNCSSVTVLLVLERLRQLVDLPTGAPVVALAFGPGLTLYAALLRQAG